MEIPEELLVCGFCHNRLESPKLLPCLHTICVNCLTTRRDNLHQCPTCNQDLEDLCAVNSLPEDKFTKSLLDFADVPGDTEEEEYKFLPKLLEELEVSQNAAKIDLKKVKLQSEEVSFDAFKNERDFFKIKRKAETQIKEKLSDLRNRFENYLKEKESDLMEKLDTALKDEEFQLSQSVIWNRSVMGSIENKEELLEKCTLQSIKSQSKALAYEKVLHEMKDHISKIGRSISKKNPVKLDISFKYNEEINEIFAKPVGEIEVRKLGVSTENEHAETRGFVETVPSSPTIVTSPFSNAVYQRTFPSLLPTDSKGYVVGITWIPTDRLVLVDKWNSKLKLYHENGYLLHVMNFSGGEPTDIVYTKGTNIRHLCIVAIPSGKLILQVAVEDKMLRLSSRITTVTGYSSISYDKRCSRLVGGVCQPFGMPRIDIISSNGTVEFTIASDLQHRPYFICPRSIDVFQYGIIAGCDWQKNRVLFITRDGTIKGSFHGTPEIPLMNPVGTTLDGREHLLVADCKKNRIHIVSCNGDWLGSYDTSAHVQGPREINVISDGTTTKMAVSHGSGLVTIYHLTDAAPSELK